MSPPPRLFGTDGIRGPAGEPPLDRATVQALGYHLAQGLRNGGGEPVVLIAGDTRDSTPLLAGWVAAGLAAGGARALDAGVLPTPAVSRLVVDHRAAAGVAISASHNPWPDNGIKLFDGFGFKWSRAAEEELEARLVNAPPVPPIAETGPPAPLPGAAESYLGELAGLLNGGGGTPLAGLSLVLDPGHGAATALAGEVFGHLGARVRQIHAAPDGRNINRGCGSTDPADLAREVVAVGADLGVAFDGDADRAILVDERGQVRDGDATLYLWASELAAGGALEPPRIVATSMSNLGLERALAARGITVARCDVGDRTVVETLRAQGLRLGGEQSGHVVDLRLASTGDGLLTALTVAAVVARRGAPLSSLLAELHRYPQQLRNVRVARKPPLDEVPAIAAAAGEVAAALGDDGRLVLRYSGTEPLARVMIEARDEATVERWCERLAAVIEDELGA